MARNISVDLNLAFSEINCLLPNFSLPIFNTCIKNSNVYTLYQARFSNSTITIMCLYKFLRLTKVSADFDYRGFVVNCAWLSEAR